MRRSKSRGMVLLLSAAAAGALVLLAGLGVLDRADLAASDAWYQARESADGDIVLVGIDQRALEEIGPYSQWSREVFARALDWLNQSEDCRPAVIGLDVLFAGQSDPDADARLARAAGRYGNVVTACAAEFGSALVGRGDGDYDLDTFSVVARSPWTFRRSAGGDSGICPSAAPRGTLTSPSPSQTCCQGSGTRRTSRERLSSSAPTPRAFRTAT